MDIPPVPRDAEVVPLRGTVVLELRIVVPRDELLLDRGADL
ncbi:MAG: hypothetical protein ACYSWO_04825 [Planctomycetota bacterium]